MSNAPESDEWSASYLPLADDPNVALVAYGTELEKRIRILGGLHGIEERSSPREILRQLARKDVVTQDAASAYDKLSKLIRSAAHGARVMPAALEVLQEQGRTMLREFDELVENTRRQGRLLT